MFPSRRLAALAFCITALLLSGCSTSGDSPPANGVGVDDPIESSKARVKFKEQGRFVRDLAASLELPRDQVCKELGFELGQGYFYGRPAPF